MSERNDQQSIDAQIASAKAAYESAYVAACSPRQTDAEMDRAFAFSTQLLEHVCRLMDRRDVARVPRSAVIAPTPPL